MKPCGRRGCGGNGRWMPVLIVWPDLPNYQGDPARAELKDLVLCERCKTGSQVADFVTDEGWEQIRAGLVAGGFQAPSRSKLGLAFMKVEEPMPPMVGQQA